MEYEITKFNFKDDLASANFNAKFQEIETYLNNIGEELTKITEENRKLKEQLDNKVEKIIYLPNNTDFDTITEIGDYCIIVGGVHAPVNFESSTATHWHIRVSWGTTASNVLYQEAYTFKVPNKIFKRYCVNGGFGSWVTFTGTV